MKLKEGKLLATVLLALFSVIQMGTTNVSADPYSTPNTGVSWNMDDLVNNSSGAVAQGMFSYIYEVHENITVSANDLLVMRAGELIHFHNGSGIIVDGELRMEGNESKVVRMTSSVFPAPERYLGIVFRNGSAGTLRFCEIFASYGGIEVIGAAPTISNCAFLQGGNGVLVRDGASPIIRNSTFIALDEQAIMVDNSSPVIVNNTITSNHIGIVILNGSSPLIESNNITENLDWGIELISSPSVVIRNNTIRYNDDYGIITYNATEAMIEGNNVSANGYLDGVDWYENMWVQNSSVYIRNSTISDAYTGILFKNSVALLDGNVLRNLSWDGIRALEGSDLTITNNAFEDSDVDTGSTSITRVDGNTFQGSSLSLGPSFVSNNTIENGSIFLYGNATLTGNLIRNATDGVDVNGGDREREVYIYDTTILDSVDNGIIASDSAVVTVVNSTVQNSGQHDFHLMDSEVTAINCTFGEAKSVANSRLIIKNYLHVLILDRNGNPMEGIPIEVYDVSPPDSMTIAHDVRSDPQGYARWLLVTDEIYTSSGPATENDTYLDVHAEGHYFSGFPRIVDMSTSHTEVAQEDVSTPPPPTVEGTDPFDGATSVPVNATVTITFSTRMNMISVENSLSIPGADISLIEWDFHGTQMVISFAPDLESGTTYEVALDRSAEDLAGAPLNETYGFSFTTEKSAEDTGLDFLSEYWWLIVAVIVLVVVVAVAAILARRGKKLPPPPPEYEHAVEREPPPPPPD